MKLLAASAFAASLTTMTFAVEASDISIEDMFTKKELHNGFREEAITEVQLRHVNHQIRGLLWGRHTVGNCTTLARLTTAH